MRLMLMVLLALAGFSANSLLTRAALGQSLLDPMDFMGIRIVSGAAMMAGLVAMRAARRAGRGSWRMAVMLAGYAIAFTLAYTRIGAAAGALLLFGAVHLTMFAAGVMAGERPSPRQLAGTAIALAGLIVLTAPGWHAPHPLGAGLMVVAGACWGIYSLDGRRSTDPTATTADNFARAALVCVPITLLSRSGADLTASGVGLAVISGALTSAIAYAVWYAALPHLAAWRAALVQLAVPVATAVAAALLLSEPVTVRLGAALGLVIGGIAFATFRK